MSRPTSDQTPADAGHVYQCQACGKLSATLSGWDADGKRTAQRGWDVSCLLNAQMVRIADIKERASGDVIA